MGMRKGEARGLVRCGRAITSREIETARETVKRCSGLSRAELAETICEHWCWVTASGVGKVTACLNVLEELERKGELQLPAKRRRPKTERVRGAEHTQRTAPPDEALVGNLEDVSPVRLELVEGRDQVKLCRKVRTQKKDKGEAPAPDEKKQYYVYVLEANLSFQNRMVIPLLSEVLNYTQGDNEKNKQDCEQRAFNGKKSKTSKPSRKRIASVKPGVIAISFSGGSVTSITATPAR